MQQQILFCYPFFRIGQWEFTPSCIFVLSVQNDFSAIGVKNRYT